MRLAPIPTPKVLWRNPPVLALAALPGSALGRLGEPSTASSAAWAAAGVAVRMLHDALWAPTVLLCRGQCQDDHPVSGSAQSSSGRCPPLLLSAGVYPQRAEPMSGARPTLDAMQRR